MLILDAPEQDVHAGELATSLILYLDPDAVQGEGTDHLPGSGKEYVVCAL